MCVRRSVNPYRRATGWVAVPFEEVRVEANGVAYMAEGSADVEYEAENDPDQPWNYDLDWSFEGFTTFKVTDLDGQTPDTPLPTDRLMEQVREFLTKKRDYLVRELILEDIRGS